MATILANICVTEYSFIDEKFAQTICQILEIELQYLIKSKHIQRFDSRAAKPITYFIYLILTISTYIKSPYFFVYNKIEKLSYNFWLILNKKT